MHSCSFIIYYYFIFIIYELIYVWYIFLIYYIYLLNLLFAIHSISKFLVPALETFYIVWVRYG